MAQATECRIPLRGRRNTIRGYVIVDAEDHDWLSVYRWHMVVSKTNTYARRWERGPDGRERFVWMHREIMDLGDYEGTVEVDHVDGNGLNNRRSNLLLSTRQMNGQTQRKIAPASSRHRGVCWDKHTRKWQVQVRVGDTRIYVGQFPTEDEAATAAREARREYLPHSRN